MSVEVLKKRLKEDDFKGVYVFWGPEDYLIKYYLKEMEKKLIDPSFKNFNYIVLEGKDLIGDIIRSCETPPLFSGKKMVVVKNSELFYSESKGKKSKSTAESQMELVNYLDKIAPDICLIFVEERVTKKTALYKAIEKNGVTVEFDYQGIADLSKWCAKIFSSYNIKIGKNEAEYLISLCSPGMNDILNEIKKIIEVVGENNLVEKKDIDCLCVKSIQGKVFEMIDSIAAGNAKKALNMLNDMIILKEPIQKIIVLIARHFKITYIVKRMIYEGCTNNKISEKISLPPFVVSKYVKQSGKYKIEMIRKAIKEILEIDRKIKTGKIDQRIALENFIAEFSN